MNEEAIRRTMYKLGVLYGRLQEVNDNISGHLGPNQSHDDAEAILQDYAAQGKDKEETDLRDLLQRSQDLQEQIKAVIESLPPEYRTEEMT